MHPDPTAGPRLSVIVPAWNASRTIENAIASVLGQSEVPLECIVVDDGSTDDTVALVEAMAARDPRLVVLHSPGNEGPSAARNRALDVARGEWLGFLDADDRLLAGGLAAMLRAADEHGALAVVGQRISTDGERTWFPVLYDLPDIREPGVKSVARNPGLLYYAGPAGKLFHWTCTQGLRFEGRLLGDQPWVLRALLRAGDRIVVLRDVVYEWRRPHPSRYVPTLTAARERSAVLGAEAATMATKGWDIVTEEFERTVDPADRPLLRRTYFERLVRADLSAQLSRAVRRGDPEIGVLFHAMAAFLGHVPADVVASTDAVARDVLEPPLLRWHRLPMSGRAAYWDLVRAALRADPAVATRGSGLPGRTALQFATRLPHPVGRPSASVLLILGRAFRTIAGRAQRARAGA